jgi:hypothetical protein
MWADYGAGTSASSGTAFSSPAGDVVLGSGDSGAGGGSVRVWSRLPASPPRAVLVVLGSDVLDAVAVFGAELDVGGGGAVSVEVDDELDEVAAVVAVDVTVVVTSVVVGASEVDPVVGAAVGTLSSLMPARGGY